MSVERKTIKVMLVEPGPFRTDFAGRSIGQSREQIADYAETAGKRRSDTAARNGNQQGDPIRAAQAIIDVINSEKPPMHLLLGAPALTLARKQLDMMRADFDTWEKTTLGADYPDAVNNF